MVAQATPLASFSELYRPSADAIYDLDWRCTESENEMGNVSVQGGLLEAASLEYEWLPPDDADERSKTSLRDRRNKPIGHYGVRYSGQAWQEWIVDASYRQGGYFRRVWGARPDQDTAAQSGRVSNEKIVATEMSANIDAVLALLPARLRTVLLTRHEPRAHGSRMRDAFGDLVRLAALSETARIAYRDAKAARVRLAKSAQDLSARPRPMTREDDARFTAEKAELGVPLERTLYDWLEGLAVRKQTGKSKKGEQQILTTARKELACELSVAYATFEEARARLPGVLYPHHTKDEREARAAELAKKEEGA